MTEKPVVRVCISPALYPLYRHSEGITVIVDIFRATSAICTALYHGVEKVIPVAAVEDALVYTTDNNMIIAAERGGEIVEGFSYGNSPLSYMNNPNIVGKTLVLTTTNGTQAIDMAKDDGDLVIGSFCNLEVLAGWLVQQNRDVMILCSGWKSRMNLEDTLFAGALADRLLAEGFGYDVDSDAAIAAQVIYQQGKNNMLDFLSHSSHKNRLKKLHLEEDIEYCLQHDIAPVVPKLHGKEIVNVLNKVSTI